MQEVSAGRMLHVVELANELHVYQGPDLLPPDLLWIAPDIIVGLLRAVPPALRRPNEQHGLLPRKQRTGPLSLLRDREVPWQAVVLIKDCDI